MYISQLNKFAFEKNPLLNEMHLFVSTRNECDKIDSSINVSE